MVAALKGSCSWLHQTEQLKTAIAVIWCCRLDSLPSMVKIGDDVLDLLQQVQSCSSPTEYAHLISVAASLTGRHREGSDVEDATENAITHFIRQSLT